MLESQPNCQRIVRRLGTHTTLLPCGPGSSLPFLLLEDSDCCNGIGGIPIAEPLRDVEAGVEGAADNEDTCDVVVAWLGCSGLGVLLLLLAAAVLAPVSSCRGRFLGPILRIGIWIQVITSDGTVEMSKMAFVKGRNCIYLTSEQSMRVTELVISERHGKSEARYLGIDRGTSSSLNGMCPDTSLNILDPCATAQC